MDDNITLQAKQLDEYNEHVWELVIDRNVHPNQRPMIVHIQSSKRE